MNKDSIKNYINSLASDRKTTITQLINVIEQNIPKGFKKVMNYGMPSFVIPHTIYPNGYHCDTTLPLPFIGVSNQKSSISLYHPRPHPTSAAGWPSGIGAPTGCPTGWPGWSRRSAEHPPA